jgi:hypothetical protein
MIGIVSVWNSVSIAAAAATAAYIPLLAVAVYIPQLTAAAADRHKIESVIPLGV